MIKFNHYDFIMSLSDSYKFIFIWVNKNTQEPSPPIKYDPPPPMLTETPISWSSSTTVTPKSKSLAENAILNKNSALAHNLLNILKSTIALSPTSVISILSIKIQNQTNFSIIVSNISLVLAHLLHESQVSRKTFQPTSANPCQPITLLFIVGRGKWPIFLTKMLGWEIIIK